jgi:hypothetical protein
VHGLFGDIEIPEQPHQRRKNTARFGPVERLYGPTELFRNIRDVHAGTSDFSNIRHWQRLGTLVRIYKIPQFQAVILKHKQQSRQAVARTFCGTFSVPEGTARMNGGAVVIVTILTGIVLSAVYLVAEYRRWIKLEIARDNRSASFRVFLSKRL